ncbi:hypothetical protein CEP54_008145 [Fusarium duplospermum]|uniref:Carboxylic ester hydrolase n=1 Tax=Fusarium duplospermum TaxID=1325734 RepID=A0A428PXI0_9HYPO|nr:hypothetical protein CEP54_008145 [Fusarium duplospermum]
MAPEAASFLQHPVIGRIGVRDGDGVVQCLGLKYASLENRLADAQIMEYPSEGYLTATRHGPPVVMPHGAVDMEMQLIQQAIPKFDVPPMSDLDGLNLNITLPKDCNKASRLPVLVFVHGGSFTFGSSSYPHYDQSRIVKLSMEMGKPIIAVNFNYRLGIPGFLSSKELSDAGFKPNRGLRDQRVALRWIKKYIPGFGGDPDQITLVGQSAGAGNTTLFDVYPILVSDLKFTASVDFHMQSEEALFSQAILFGGSSALLKPREPEEAESVYNSAIRALALDEQSPESRIGSLLSIPVEVMLAKASNEMIAVGPTIDHDLIPAAATLDANDMIESPISSNRWCKSLFSIDSQFDGSIFNILSLHSRQQGITTSFQTHLIKTLGQTAASKVLDHYNIRDNTPDEESLLSITQAITDVGYYALSVKFAESFPGDCVLGHLNEPNPWDGVHTGWANHILDIAYLWGNYDEKYGQENRHVARSLAEDVLSFVNGGDNLPAFGAEEKKVVVYGPGIDGVSRQILRWNDGATARDGTIFELAKEVGGLGKLLEALLSFC